MKTSFPLLATMATALCSCAPAVLAQPTTTAEAVITPPPPVVNVTSIDAHNHVIIETQEAPNAPKEYSLVVPRHIYSGALARIFGGVVIPTEVLVIPQSALRGGATNNFGNNNFGNNTFGNFNRR